MGDYRDKSGSERVDAPEKIDLTNIMLNRKTWGNAWTFTNHLKS